MEGLVELKMTNNAGLVEDPETMANTKKGKVTGSKKGTGASNRGGSSCGPARSGQMERMF